MITDAQNRANLRSAERVVAISLGIDRQDGAALTSLSYDERTTYVKALAAYIVAHPAAFVEASLSTARAISAQNLSPLDDPSFDWDNFAGAVADNALAIGDSVADVGRGAQAALSSLKWVLPLALLVGVVIVLKKFNDRPALV